MAISIIILNFNTPRLTEALLSSLAEVRGSAELDFEVLVVNLTPNDGLHQMIKEKYPWVREIEAENRGFAANNNVAIPHTSGRYLLFLNSDTGVPVGTLKEMARLMDTDKKIGAATCYLELASGGMDVDCHRGFPTPWASFCFFSKLEKLFPHSKLFGQYHQTWKDFSKTHEIDACCGAFMMVRREVVEKVGAWDEQFFFYGEDLDWCYRMKEASYKIIYHPVVKIIHHKGATSGIRKESRNVSSATQETRRKIAKASTDAMRIFYNKHYRQKYPFFITWLVLIGVKLLEKLRLSRL
jgi:GT2 family glycosyltransferase